MKRAILNFRAAWLSLILAGLTLTTIPAAAMKDKSRSLNSAPPPASITLEAKQGGNIATQWIADWRESDPMLVNFRWSTTLGNIQSAQWQVLNPIQLVILGRGNAGPVPAANGFTQFNIDFRNIAGATKHRPLKYVVRVVLFSKLGSPGGSNQLPPSPVVKVSFVGSGPVTQFNLTGLRPELLSNLPLAVDLQSLQVLAGGDGQEPYIFAVTVYADGTTIKPAVVAKKAQFGNSSVRIQSAPQTHGNITSGSVDEAEVVPIPSATGHFETNIKPIGLELAEKFKLDNSWRGRARKFTRVAVVVVALEEGSFPPTTVIEEVRAEMISEIQTEFDKILRGISIPIDDPTAAKAVEKAVDEAIKVAVKEITDRLIASAKAKGIDEFFSYLKLPFGQAITSFLSFAALNRDEFVGVGIKTITYQDFLDAGEGGIPFDLNLTNADNDLHYLVRGRARLR